MNCIFDQNFRLKKIDTSMSFMAAKGRFIEVKPITDLEQVLGYKFQNKEFISQTDMRTVSTLFERFVLNETNLIWKHGSSISLLST